MLGCCPVGRPRPAGVGERATWRTRLAAFLESTPVHLATLCLLLIDLILTALDLSASLLSCSRGEGEGGGGGGERFYRWFGIGILCLLSTKIAALALALGVSFLRSPGHVVDAVVVVGALLLELLKEGAGGDAGGLLVVVSLWRVVRVVEGAFELSNEAIEEQIEEITSQFQVLKAENRRLEEELLDKDKRIAELEQQQLALLRSAAPQ